MNMPKRETVCERNSTRLAEDKVIDQDFIKTAMMEAFPCKSSVFILCNSNEPCKVQFAENISGRI